MEAGSGMMSRELLQQVDTTQPWLLPLAGLLTRLLQSADADDLLPAFNDLARGQRVHNGSGLPLEVVPQNRLPAGVAYETFIYEHGQVPSRANLHDFFNALIWLRYPSIKRQLNVMQAACIREAGDSSVSQARSPVVVVVVVVVIAGPSGRECGRARRTPC